MMCARCVSAVRTEMKSCFAISWFVWPRASRRSTSRSRSESGSASARLRRLGVGGDQPRAELGVDVAAAAGDLADRRDDLGVRRLLEHVAARAGRERLADVARVVLHREHEHLRVGLLVQQLSGSASSPLCSGMTTSSRITSGFSARASKTASRGVAGLADRLDVLLGLEQQPQAGADDGVVVDDQHADAHRSGTSATSVVPAPGARLDLEPPVESATRSRMPTSPTPSSRTARGSKPRPSSSITAATRRPAPGERDADAVRARVLDDVRERLLHDPVERRLDLGRQPRLAERRVEVDARCPSAPRTSRSSRSSAGTRPKSSSAAGRSSTASRRTSCSVATTSSRSSARAARAASSASASSSGFSPSRIEVSACPVSSWSSRASRRRSSSCACDDAPERVARDPLRELDGDGGAGGERLGEAEVVVGEARVGPVLVVRRDHADRLVARDQRHPQAGAGAEPPRRPPGRTSGSSSTESIALAPPRARARAALRPASGRSSCRAAPRAVAGDGGEPQLVAAARAARSRRAARRAARAAARTTRSSSRVEVGLGRERVADLVQRLELPRPARSPPRRAARSRSPPPPAPASSVTSSSSSSVKSSPPCLLGQVEVAVGDAAQQDRHAEERAHRRMARREADRARILARGRAAAAASRRGSARRGCRARAAGRRSPRASRRRCRA